MAHVPHVLIPPPWAAGLIELDDEHRRHLSTVLRRKPGSPLSYTDGEGVIGHGTLTNQGIERGPEETEPAPADRLTLAVAPPDSKDRVRWLVEKCTELGVARIRWLKTEYGQGRIPRHDKSHAWVTGAIEQSRRSRITEVDQDWSALSELGSFVAAQQGGAPFRPSGSVTIAIGPEGGWSPSELDHLETRVTLGSGVLRTETAAVAAAAIFSAVRNQ